jgi:hypothetical protein
MGKAAVIGAAIVLLAIIVAFVILWLNRDKRVGDLDRQQEQEMRQLLGEAAYVMRNIGPGIHLGQEDILSDRSRRAVRNWLVRYEDKVESYGGGS